MYEARSIARGKHEWTKDRTLRDNLTHLEAFGVLGRPRGGILGRADVRKLCVTTGEVAISFLVMEISAGRKLEMLERM